ncbi:MAG: acetoacetate decarboxylase family protein [Deltaproteobacteria bacterium]|nr:acetoacetate decarboxylase family protein [Deltaproteobacteria bacterium]
MKDIFTNLQETHHRVTAGEVTLPIRYTDCRCLQAVFALPTEEVQRRLPSTRLSPFRLTGGKSLLAVNCFEYRATSIGLYNEVSLSFPCLYDAWWNLPWAAPLLEKYLGHSGVYVWHLPVTTRIARDAGRELWGYPKFVAEIGFEEKGGRTQCTLAEGGKTVVELALDHTRKEFDETRVHSTFSIKDGKLMLTPISVQLGVSLRRMKPTAELRFGDHQLGRELAGMHISRRPVETRYLEPFRSVLPAGRFI